MKKSGSNFQTLANNLEQVVTDLLRTTKLLLEALTQWSFIRKSSKEIYTICDTLEKQFHLVTQTFEDTGIPMSDLQWIPLQLSEAVSIAMVKSPSPTVLDQYLPRIREVIVNLLQGLKAKQNLLREQQLHQYTSSLNAQQQQRRTVGTMPLGKQNKSCDNHSGQPTIISDVSPERTSTHGIVTQPVIPQKTMQQHKNVDERDPRTAHALAALKKQENLARRSSVRRSSKYYRDNQTLRKDGQDTLIPPLPPHLPSEPSSNTETRKTDQTLILFLQMGQQVQKVTYDGELTIPALNILFVKTFNHSLAVDDDLPKIYIKDPEIGIFYELVDISDIHNKCILSYQMKENTMDQEAWIHELINLIKEEQSETRRLFLSELKELKKQTNKSYGGQTRLKRKEEPVAQTISKEQLESQQQEIETLRRDIAILRQINKEMRDETSKVITDIKEKAVAKEHTEAKPSTILEESRTLLEDKSDTIITRLEDLQDTIDQLKLDVTQRHCRPSEVQMAHCAKERQGLAEDIEAFGNAVAQVKPRWKKTWERELQTIVKEQQLLKDQEQLSKDMKEDLKALVEVYEQLEKVCEYQQVLKSNKKTFKVVPQEEGVRDVVLKQVNAIDVDHERRMRALEQADKMRQRELANRMDDFEKELSRFVEMEKLKKTGGTAEMDRVRKQKDEEMLKALYTEKKMITSGIE